MQWANVGDMRSEAHPDARGICPCCGGRVIPKCGYILAWHWAHESLDCDPWYEPESEWHRLWKLRYPREWQEVVIGPHRADLRTPTHVIELQSSHIAPEDIIDREAFYTHHSDMVWLINGETLKNTLRIRDRGNYVSFRWKHPRKAWWVSRVPIYIDMQEDGILEIKKLHTEARCAGWGYMITPGQFVAMHK